METIQERKIEKHGANFTYDLPHGYYLDSIDIENLTAASVVISIGTTAGGGEIIDGYTVMENSYNNGLQGLYPGLRLGTYTFDRKKRFQPRRTSRIHITSADWNGAKVKFIFNIKSFM